jgi:hypothetical protein
MSFGYGVTICPRCYEGEKEFIFLDNSFILNRFLSLFSRRTVSVGMDEGVEDVLLGQDFEFHEQNIVHEEM